ncbi:MAG: 3-phosphoshikimate 1-carboxyvinyltransferase [Halobacteria archaeon]|nr:3-phosphoshikimate 1-carboxyvinyltransferase [Halobacteria archaeon]
MKIRVSPSEVSGRVSAPPSKSYSHRAVLAGSLSDEARVLDPLMSADIRASIRCAEGFGAEVEDEDEDDGSLSVDGVSCSPETPDDVLDCGNSGTTLRLFTGTAAVTDDTTVLTGDRSLRSRPNDPLLKSVSELGSDAFSTRRNGCAPLVVDGRIDRRETSIDGTVSSQFISSLLFAAPLTPDGVDIEIENELRSRPYVDITLEVLDEAGIDYEETQAGFDVEGDQTYDLGEFRVPGDFSSASYPLAAGAIAGGEVEVENLFPGPQGDSVILDVLDRMGADIDWDTEEGVVRVTSGDLSGTEFDASDSPDLVPTVAVLGAVAQGETRIYDAEHLRYKETDRLAVITEELRKLGAEVEEGQDYLVVDGDATDLRGADVSGHHDHRIVMALSLAGLVADGETVVDTAETVSVSYPDFVEAMGSLGAEIESGE